MTTTAPAFDLYEGRPDFDTVYTRCPGCGIVGTPSGVDYPIDADGDPVPGARITLTCTPAGHTYQVTTTAFLVRDTVRACSRAGCRTVIPCPAEADQVVCPTCRLHQPGPFLNLDDDRRRYVHQVHAGHSADVRARLRQLRG